MIYVCKFSITIILIILGLNIKFDRRSLMMPGYTRRVTKSFSAGKDSEATEREVWEYRSACCGRAAYLASLTLFSDKAVEVVKLLSSKFPDLIAGVCAAPNCVCNICNGLFWFSLIWIRSRKRFRTCFRCSRSSLSKYVPLSEHLMH